MGDSRAFTIEGTTEDQARQVLGFLHVDIASYQKLSHDKQEKLDKALSDLLPVLDSLKKKGQLNPHVIINWMEILNDLEKRKLDFFPLQGRALDSLGKKAEPVMTFLFFGFNLLALILSCGVNAGAFNVSTSQESMALAAGGNAVDSGLGFAVGLRQYAQGEKGLGLANMFSGVQLGGVTIGANLAASAALGSLLMGMSFVVCLLISYGTEQYEISKCEKRIATLEEDLRKIERQLKDSEDTDGSLKKKRDHFEKILLIENAKRANHEIHASTHLACAVVMAAVACFSFFVLSGITLGTFPLVALAMAVGISLVRGFVVGKPMPFENVKGALQNESKGSWIGRLNTALQTNTLDLRYDSKITIPGLGIFQDKTMTLKSRLLELAVRNPVKFKEAVIALEKNNEKAFKNSMRGLLKLPEQQKTTDTPVLKNGMANSRTP